MNPNANQARQVFVAAVKLAPEQWEAYLAEACAGDEDLRGRVRKLLTAHQEAGSFLAAPAQQFAATLDEPASEVSMAAKTGTGLAAPLPLAAVT